MGCDIHIVTEIKENGKWKGVDEFPNALDGRNYHLFSFLANVRNYFNTVGFKPKGLPEDLSTKKFRFRSETPHMKNLYEESGRTMFAKDGKYYETGKVDLYREVSLDEYEKISNYIKENTDEAKKQYGILSKSFARENPTYSVQDAYAAGGVFEHVPYKTLYPTFDEYAKDCWSDEWDEDVQDYGSWEVNFEFYEESGYGDYHSANYLSLQELLDADTSDYTAMQYKIDKTFYNTFIENGGVLPDIFKVKGDTEPGDIAECFREALEPTIVISWQRDDESKKEMPLFKGIEELKAIAEKYNITNPNDIRIVFAFDN